MGQGVPHRSAQAGVQLREYGPVVDELKRPMDIKYKTENVSTTLIALLHYRIKSKEVWVVVGDGAQTDGSHLP